MDKVASLSKQEREELFSESARQMKTTNAIVEKDFWVVWVLDKLFSDARLNKMLMFKGGTSLSKVFDLIGRFSEDIDLILDWNLVTGEDPQQERSKNRQDRYNKEVNENAKRYIEEILLPGISELTAPHCKCQIDPRDGHSINITYPSSFDDAYLRPQILLEIGPLASWLPSDTYEISSYAAQYFPQVFDRTTCKVNAIVAERTFWEKVTILHQEANRTMEKPLPLRYSRHYYDLAVMAISDVRNSALNDLTLLDKVIEFKQKFYPASWAKFEEAKPSTLKIVPPKYRIAELAKDYKAMENMIFAKKLGFDEIIEILTDLESEINSLK